ncbi:MBL fold metallo-hydrolase [Geminocystis sp. GBBB08]|uniref:MBL fold metallo-hydrolase n=1 Tax=Geminocystis sp. GBBB08 TaxID=2604140 RepID=UPI0027E36DB4|nr:MBL fold metallo-hydrolase [Geminocystis sp. GBBB08]MBL1209066.1 MBL fold metallo-hydrolase [Geminocystis sp. GBBB08]
MAKVTQRRKENVEGDFFVDDTCIDCDTCRWIAPEIFTRQGDKSAVYSQPATAKERQHSLQALLSCPTSSIGTINKPQDIRQIQQSFPLLIDDNVYYCGYHSEKSYGAASYFIQRFEGNILIDSPRFNTPLVTQLEKMGGVKYLYLTHQDDVADHQLFRDHFNCDRILHQNEIKRQTENVEIKLDITEPWTLAQDLLIIPTPGHSKGHTVLLYKNKFLFTGDHLAWSNKIQKLVGFRDYCWYSWQKVIESTEKLTQYNFEWILPGHGRRYQASPSEMQRQLSIGIDWMKENTTKNS